MKSNYTIAVCDILGFKQLVKKVPVETVVDVNLGNVKKALHHSIHQSTFPENVPSLRDFKHDTKIGLAWFSDSILLYTLEDTAASTLALYECLSWLLFETMFMQDSRLRCAVASGEMCIDAEESIFVGQPLNDALDLEKAQNWSGGALTASAIARVDASSLSKVDCHVVDYPVPTKPNWPSSSWAIDWTCGIHNGSELVWSKDHTTPTHEDWVNRYDICLKWHNMKKFHDSVCRDCSPGRGDLWLARQSRGSHESRAPRSTGLGSL